VKSSETGKFATSTRARARVCGRKVEGRLGQNLVFDTTSQSPEKVPLPVGDHENRPDDLLTVSNHLLSTYALMNARVNSTDDAGFP